MPNSNTDEERSTNTSRQQPGLACEQCRARKLRCDRTQPQCASCKSLGISCNPSTVRQPRGPKKGHIKAMQSRLSALEKMLSDLTETGTGVSASHARCVASAEASSEHETNIQTMHGSHAVDEEDFQMQGSLEDITPKDVVPPQPYMSSQGNFSSPQLASNVPISPFTSGLVGLDQSEYHKPPSLYFDFTTTPSEPDILPSPALPTVPFLYTDSCSGSSTTGQMPSLPPIPATPLAVLLNDLTRADLNHLYFDRVHMFIPILNRRRYFARASRLEGTITPFTCLQNAIWTLAASTSSQFQHIQSMLYSQTRMMLEILDLDASTEKIPLDYAQIWALLAIYEITQVDFRRGWLSAGRCFRLVQLLKLHMLDTPSVDALQTDLDWVDVEERRRTFWTAYSLDRFMNLMNQLPLMLNEQVISTRLPASESAFQREQPIETKFLSQIITGNGDETLSPFTQSIILVTISGRCLSHQQQGSVERLYGNVNEEFWERHQWLDGILTSKIQSMLALSGHESEPAEPMALFTNMMAHATTLSLYMAMRSVDCGSGKYHDIVRDYEKRAVRSAHEITTLSKRLVELNYYKVHPLTPLPLYLCAEFARAFRRTDSEFQGVFLAVCETLSDLRLVNRLAQTCLSKLGHEAGEVGGDSATRPTCGV
ncbi:hypothetical protein K461DRAFT_166727 [Myriangium duriaei CBS 260.36]|uniref:Zn(2)-C6 fungal-type domain-containing protein n=1 Tax=Myriangium duriaei CBS 260.36 TaxID=1168546 RepID=A0A9P4J294_9PEZI|nr:hypothetical protein K461DRAFT_166727 [Myriangium duriaei CBS 260.36]